jgi:hypothetical protein
MTCGIQVPLERGIIHDPAGYVLRPFSDRHEAFKNKCNREKSVSLGLPQRSFHHGWKRLAWMGIFIIVGGFREARGRH